MNSKKIIVIILVVLFAFGGLGMMSLGNMGSSKSSSNQQGETQAEMMARMHPDRQRETQAEMMARMHPDIRQTSTSSDENMVELSTSINADMGSIELSEAIGKQAPDFTLIQTNGSTFTLSDYSDKTVVLFFSGGAMCYPACWNQIEEMGSDKRFNNEKIITASIVVDTKEKWDKIISSQPKFGVGRILLDSDKEVSKAYSVLYAPSSMHKGSFPGHTYIVIKKGVITYTLDDPRMAINTDEVALEL